MKQLTKEYLVEEVEEVSNTLLNIDTIIKNLEMQTSVQDDLVVKMSSVFESLSYISKMLNK